MIEILVSTINDNIFKTQIACSVIDNRVKYTVIHQVTNNKHYDYKIFKKRKDVRVISMREGGVTKSRNVGILHASSEICLFSDDDVVYKRNYIDTIIDYFKNNENTDVCIFKIETPEGQKEYRNYENFSYKLNKSIGVGTIQIAFRLQPILRNKIFFDERFGAGNKFLIGADERIFIHDCIKSKLNVYYYPAFIVQHPYESTQKKINKYDYANARLAGGVNARIKGSLSLLLTFASFVKHFFFIIREGYNPFSYLYHRIKAYVYVVITNKKYRNRSSIPKLEVRIEKEYYE